LFFDLCLFFFYLFFDCKKSFSSKKSGLKCVWNCGSIHRFSIPIGTCEFLSFWVFIFPLVVYDVLEFISCRFYLFGWICLCLKLYIYSFEFIGCGDTFVISCHIFGLSKRVCFNVNFWVTKFELIPFDSARLSDFLSARRQVMKR
jgi:hypothetical protein